MKYGVVYKLTCSCGSSYIGQTRRNLINRLKVHSSSDKSEVCRHLMDNPDHKMDFAKPNILSSSGDSARLLILESLFIQKYEPLLNVDSKSLTPPLYLSKSNLHYTRRNTPKRVTSCGAHLRGLAPGLHSSEETSQRWRVVGDLMPI